MRAFQVINDMPPILAIAIIISLGFFLGEVAKKLHFPKVTGYIIAGLILNPHLFRIVPKHFTDHTDIVTSLLKMKPPSRETAPPGGKIDICAA